ncbi:MAG: NADH-quinone oxidoreductase subunit I [Chlorobi bacterium]|nr:NADH-quinone oxidoreductase subunit I [Chlorobiota bacterium]
MKEYFKNTWDGLYTAFVGMKITFQHLFVPSVTIQYPSVKPPLPERARNRLYVNMADCIGCLQCARACPVNCIEIETVKAVPGDEVGNTSQGKKKALWVTKFDIDFAKCCYCQLCVFPCPTECIKMTEVYEFSEYNREDLIYNFTTLNLDEIREKEEKYEKFQAEKEAQKLAAAKAKAEAAAKAKAEKEAAEKAVAETKTEETQKPEESKPAEDEKENGDSAEKE